MSSTAYTPKLSTQTVLVIGGTSGIGLAIAAEALAQSAAHVTIAGSTQTKLSNALSHLRSNNKDDRISGYTCDLSNPATIESNLRALLDATVAGNGTGRIDHVAFTAGDALGLKPLAELTIESVQAAGTVRFMGVLMLAKLLPAYAAPGPTSSLTLTGGVNTNRPSPGWTVPAAYGAATQGVMRGLAVDLKPLRVNMVEPGAVETPLWDSVPGASREPMKERFAARSTVGRVGRPEDTAEAYVYLMKDYFAVGTIVESNGGTLLV
ncbi:Short-chain dehydrogenase/reductase SDR [Lasiodiplodia theobromae]|uniref:Putative oxidoreductase YghA n=1 Tax=Lasiodiplodia theobromae TaxID=45133 RepID=A0A5N5D8H6_9PEZI|nr:Short-chain dehydrogenase/reductase SDR [Lasiodiplodia theobromae]KAB2573951.1 putative oxidoreductase YghA [Lasiodiplodia theobromae]KAF4538269.1 Short-chain dehydrogenase/reductase SDR [Lasiodiplodia theobromae]KAF9633351.1 Short-chain dehydrogenase/reductase SDR [Lasiodiplodia theobromae]